MEEIKHTHTHAHTEFCIPDVINIIDKIYKTFKNDQIAPIEPLQFDLH